MQKLPRVRRSPCEMIVPARNATTLVEVIVLTTLASILLVSATALIVRLQRWDRRVRDGAIKSDQSLRLVEAIRRDVRHATKVAAPSKKVLLIAGPDGREVRYSLDGDLCRRETIIGGSAPKALEIFTAGASEAWKVDAAAPGRRPAYAISIERPKSETVTSHAVPIFVYAVQGSELP